MSTQATLPPETPAEAKSGGGVVLHRLVRGHLRATLYLGDCLAIMPQLEAVDALVSDPPYGIDYALSAGNHTMPDGSKRWYPAAEEIEGNAEDFDPAPLLKYPIVALWGANHYAHRLPHNGKWLVWDKRCQVIPPRNQADCEMAWLNKYGAARMLYHMWDGMVRDSERDTPRVHPTQKPVVVMAWMMEQAKVPEGATVLDPYMGSGTTGVACWRTNRNFVGIEKDPKHFASAVARLEREANQGVLL